MDNAAINTDRELWREVPDDYYSPSVFVTENGSIGINVGGNCLTAYVREWHKAGQITWCIDPKVFITTESDGSQWVSLENFNAAQQSVQLTAFGVGWQARLARKIISLGWWLASFGGN